MTARSKQRKMISSFMRTMLASAFPIAGAIIVIYTLSGPTRRMATILTIIGVAAHIIHSMMELMDGDDDEPDLTPDAPGLQGLLDMD